MTYFYSAMVMHADGTKTYVSTTAWAGEDMLAIDPDTLAEHVAKAIKCEQSDVVITSLSQAPHFKPKYRLD